MLKYIRKIQEYLKNHKKGFANHRFNEVFEDNLFLFIDDNFLHEKKLQLTILFNNIKRSNVLIIGQSEKLNNEIPKLIICFEKTSIILQITDFSMKFLHSILSANPELKVCFLSNAKTFIENEIKITNQKIEVDENFLQEINHLKMNFRHCKKEKEIEEIWNSLFPFISAYLIKKNYMKLKKYRIEKFIRDFDKDSIPQIINENDYVELRTIGTGSSFECILIYCIKQGGLYVLKKPYGNNQELNKLLDREALNYSKVKHPFLPKYFGRVKHKNYIIIEYINGQLLRDIKKIKLTENEVLTIIFELMLIMKYFHDNKMIYRDLKPNNIMIDENKTVVLIDLDRLIENKENIEQTLDLGGDFVAPEIKTVFVF